MPHMDGVELCRRIRAMSTVPIIVLSVKGEERTKVEALDSRRRRLRHQAVRHRRAAGARARGAAPQRRRRERGARRSRRAISASTSKRAASTRAASEVRLTPKEFDLFVYMARHPNRVLTHAHAARSGVGRSVAGAAGVPARVHGAAAQEARTGSVEPALPRHRAVGRISIQSTRVTVVWRAEGLGLRVRA